MQHERGTRRREAQHFRAISDDGSHRCTNVVLRLGSVGRLETTNISAFHTQYGVLGVPAAESLRKRNNTRFLERGASERPATYEEVTVSQLSIRMFHSQLPPRLLQPQRRTRRNRIPRQT